MHMSDALVSPGVAISGGVIAATLIGLATNKVKTINRNDLMPLMGVMGAFVFAAQMINFTIPGTGSSGHLIGGILLSAILGPWAGFLTLSSILIVQCLIFADGGLLALGCNIINMAVTTCLIAYPLIYKPITRHSIKSVRIFTASILSCIGALLIGSLAVTVETELSGITALPFKTFLGFMLPIHLVIGVVEGIVTAAILNFIAIYRPETLIQGVKDTKSKINLKGFLAIFGIITLLLAALFSVIASEYPDGLEWSIEKVAGTEDMSSAIPPTAILPEYNSTFAGIIGSIIIMLVIWAFTSILFSRFRKDKKKA